MLKAVFIAIILLVIAFLLLGIQIIFTKNGKFPNTHIGASKAMRERGIGCATSQDREAQKDIKNVNTFDIVKQVTKNN